MKPGGEAGYDLYKIDEDTGKVIDWEKRYSAYAQNFTESDVMLKNVPICSFLFYIDDEKDGSEVELPGGLVFNHGTTEEDITTAYGEPQDIAYNKAWDGYVTTDLDYKKREGDFIKNVHFKVVDQIEASARGYVSVLFQYVHEPEGEE